MARWGRKKSRGFGYGYRDQYPPYVPVSARRERAEGEAAKMLKAGKALQPLRIERKKIALTYWGIAWCEHLESFSDFENRLPRGRTYARNGSVLHVEIKAGEIEAFVMGSVLYEIKITIGPLDAAKWKSVKDQCAGRVGSMIELLKGQLSEHVMSVVAHRKDGLFPLPSEIKLSCSCPDYASMCKHVAAAMYGIGNRLDSQPELLFHLRGVDAAELISTGIAIPGADAAAEGALSDDALAGIFGIDLEAAAPTLVKKPAPPGPRAKAKKAPVLKKAASKPAPAEPIVMAPAKKPKTAPKPAAVQAAKPATKQKKAAPKLSPSDLFDPLSPTGASLAALRRRSGLTPKQFAASLGINLSSVTRWEKDRGSIFIGQKPLKAIVQFQDSITQPQTPPAATKRKKQ
ncbi:hypothetical protein BH09SUM1_BH09SUM1_33400 [soil metagenome]